ncbi:MULTISPECIES: menaquinone-dependent protoporphyrinogen IX dehydrogenase [Prochlorococcus]|uniref:Protoporphyrinogen IX dehydrogenase [quinone] n=1 Tax=Prochlorococcus marinus str. MIT 9116 TaxID=167544 RepID=A0A0A1ZLW7_PROMR|nr:menaquinone-dependent protoporphyrinogen IX dehydrogenase [Prochlorococcus marinus]KGF89566.1 Protoporphyrinogen IX oxidase [Prochlorococcus marinus str. MIT 9107]KGF90425.1 Protoporphyrinogen IX oxidase [Prochlorococcus marinus str. MIT 9116]KGF92904.1 Protoporphyrinogen IX oxidase [Prochlorococcus marinus str. MIT 9123]
MFWRKSKLLIIYSTVDGHTKEICNYIYKKLKGRKKVSIISVEDSADYDLNDFEEIVIGASVRYGYHRKNVYKFIQQNIEKLDKVKTAFFSLNLTARKPEKSTPETNPYVVKFLKKVKWEPTVKEVFAGRLDYPSLDTLNKLAILFIMFITNGPKDTSKTYELTDWEKVDSLINSISKF